MAWPVSVASANSSRAWPRGARIAHSYFLVVDASGAIAISTPALTNHYHRDDPRLGSLAAG